MLGEDHGETIHAEGDARGGGHPGEGRKKTLRHGIDGTVVPRAVAGGLLKAPALLRRIGQLGKGVGQLQGGDIELKPFGETGIIRLHPRQGAERRGIFVQEDGVFAAQVGLDCRDHDLVEPIPPERLFDAERGIPGKGLPDGDPLPGRRQIDPPPLPGEGAAQTELRGDAGDQGLAVVHQRPVIGFRTIPFEHGKLGKVAGTPLPRAETAADLEDFRITRRQEPLHAELRGGLEKPVVRGDGIDMGFRRRRRNPEGCFDFEKILVEEESADRPDHRCPELQGIRFGAQPPLFIIHPPVIP